jgi:hypothetical protein
LSQTNDNANCVPEEDRFKFVDDLTTLEVINLLTIGLSSLYALEHQLKKWSIFGYYFAGVF